MADDLLRFVSIDQAPPKKRSAEERAADFQEIYDRFVPEKAAEQASRCSQCGVPYCHIHCPLGNNIPDWLKLTAEGRLEEAYQVAAETNNMPEICGRICPQDRLCEGNCVIETGFQSVTIGSVEKYLTDTAFDEGWVASLDPIEDRTESIGIIGAGPAGLAAAEQLRQQGFQITIYDRYDRAGGLLIYGIPGFKLEKPVVTRRTDRLVDGGIDIKTNFEVGRDASLADLRAQHDAVLIATGVYKARELQCPGVGLPGVEAAMDYLTIANRRDLGDALDPDQDSRFHAKGRHVAVIGGGDTAMDCVRTAVRQGAASVTCLYRRDRANMPGSAREVQNAEEEGVVFRWLSSPLAVLGDTTATGVRVQNMRLGPQDVTGRRSPVAIEGDTSDIKADLVIQALGYDAEDLPTLFGEEKLPVNRWGTIKVAQPSQMTDLDGVFAAGDIVRGASLVVWAIKDGRDAAEGIQTYLEEGATESKEEASQKKETQHAAA